MLAANLHRRGAETVLGEHAGDRATSIERHQGQVAAIFLADFGLGDTETNPGNREKLIGGGSGVVDGHSHGSKSIKAPLGCLGGNQ